MQKIYIIIIPVVYSYQKSNLSHIFENDILYFKSNTIQVPSSRHCYITIVYSDISSIVIYKILLLLFSFWVGTGAMSKPNNNDNWR